MIKVHISEIKTINRHIETKRILHIKPNLIQIMWDLFLNYILKSLYIHIYKTKASTILSPNNFNRLPHPCTKPSQIPIISKVKKRS